MAGQISEIIIESQQLQERIRELGAAIDEDYQGRKPLLVCVLKGAIFFIADLMRATTLDCEVDFMALASYGSATTSSGVVRIIKDLDAVIEGRDVIVVEDIVDSGLTLNYLVRMLTARSPNSLEICALLAKPQAKSMQLPVKYLGFEIPDQFVVGYGLDYAEQYRSLPYVACMEF